MLRQQNKTNLNSASAFVNLSKSNLPPASKRRSEAVSTIEGKPDYEPQTVRNIKQHIPSGRAQSQTRA
jgi:hypothetical protein